MSDRKLGIWLAFLVPLIFTVIGPYSVGDLANWAAEGRYLLEHRGFPAADPFSILSTSPQVFPCWALSIVYALVFRAGGLVALCLLHQAALAALLWIVYRGTLLAAPSPWSLRLRWLLYASWLGAVAAFAERPATIALIPLALAYLTIARIGERISGRQIAGLCALGAAWVNLHGSFALLPAMLAWRILWLRLPRLPRARDVGALLAVCAATFANPFGWRVYPYVWQTARLSRARGIEEWLPTTPLAHFPNGALYFALAAWSAWLLARRARAGRLRVTAASPFFVLLLAGASAIRNSALPFLMLLPFAAEQGLLAMPAPPHAAGHAAGPGPGARARLRNAFVLAAFLGALVAVSPPVKPLVARWLPERRREIFDQSAPFRAAAAIRESGKGCAIFNDWEAGGFLMLELPNRIFVDGRNILYSDEDILAYRRASDGLSGWERFIEGHGACLALVSESSQGGLIRAMEGSGRWKSVLVENGMRLLQLSIAP